MKRIAMMEEININWISIGMGRSRFYCPFLLHIIQY